MLRTGGIEPESSELGKKGWASVITRVVQAVREVEA